MKDSRAHTWDPVLQPEGFPSAHDCEGANSLKRAHSPQLASDVVGLASQPCSLCGGNCVGLNGRSVFHGRIKTTEFVQCIMILYCSACDFKGHRPLKLPSETSPMVGTDKVGKLRNEATFMSIISFDPYNPPVTWCHRPCSTERKTKAQRHEANVPGLGMRVGGGTRS